MAVVMQPTADLPFCPRADRRSVVDDRDVSARSSGTTLNSRVIAIDDDHVHCLEAGPPAGPPIILLHGLATLGAEIMGAMAPTLAGRGYRVMAVDRPGYGGSSAWPYRANTPRRQAEWLGQVIDGLGVGPMTIMAHSSGAAVALWLAVLRPTAVLGLVLLSPFVRPTRPAPAPLLRLSVSPMIGPVVRRGVLPILAPVLGPLMMKTALGPDQDQGAPVDLPWRTLSQETAILAMAGELLGFNANMKAIANRLEEVQMPVLVVGGRKDRVIAVRDHVDWLATHLKQTRTAWLPRQGHLVHHGASETVARLMTEAGAIPSRMH